MTQHPRVSKDIFELNISFRKTMNSLKLFELFVCFCLRKKDWILSLKSIAAAIFDEGVDRARDSCDKHRKTTTKSEKSRRGAKSKFAVSKDDWACVTTPWLLAGGRSMTWRCVTRLTPKIEVLQMSERSGPDSRWTPLDQEFVTNFQNKIEKWWHFYAESEIGADSHSIIGLITLRRE